MSTRTLVWAFQPLPELDQQTGLVECDEALARELLQADKVQDPRIGAIHLREIQAAAPPAPAPIAEHRHEYQTTNLTPPTSKKRR